MKMIMEYSKFIISTTFNNIECYELQIFYNN